MPALHHTMNAIDTARARQYSYGLLGRLFLEGVQDDLLSFVRAIPSLARALPAHWNADEAASAHQHLWGFGVFPYESLFLDDSGLLGGLVTARVQAHYRRAGFGADLGDTSADHIGLELRFLGFLSAAEADAWEADLEPTARHIQVLQRGFLEEHLLRWLLPLVQTVRRQAEPFYAALADLMLEVVQAHGETVGVGRPAAWSLPPPAPLLDDERTGLHEIARYFTTPPHCGLFLTRDDIGTLARALDLPRGFGSRQQLLVNLLRAAAQYDALPTFLTRLHALFEAMHRELGAWATQPPLASFAKPWRARLGESLVLLEQLRAHSA